jgi:hypothetical protein
MNAFDTANLKANPVSGQKTDELVDRECRRIDSANDLERGVRPNREIQVDLLLVGRRARWLCPAACCLGGANWGSERTDWPASRVRVSMDGAKK